MEQKKNNIKILYNDLIFKLLKHNLKQGKYTTTKKKIDKNLYVLKKKINIFLFLYNLVKYANTFIKINKNRKIYNISKNEQINSSIRKIKNITITKSNIKNILINSKINDYTYLKKNKFLLAKKKNK